MRNIKSKRFAYLAGLVDGDGSISIRYNETSNYQLTLTVYSTSPTALNFLQQQFAGQIRKMPTSGNRKQKYAWYTSNHQVIRGVAPYLIIKSDQGKLACQFLDLAQTRNPVCRSTLYTQLKQVNSFFAPINDRFFIAPNHHPQKSDFAQLAGLMDAEGSFLILRRHQQGNGKYTSAIKFSNTDARIFPWIMERFGGVCHVHLHHNYRNEGSWKCIGEPREKLLLALIPYLVTKRKQAIILLEWIRLSQKGFPERRDYLYQEMKKLNHRGLSPETNTLSACGLQAKIESDLHGNM